jgi:hypothetical protein
MEDLTDLFTHALQSGRPWTPTPDQLEWLQFIADGIMANGRKPTVSWRELTRRFARRWPDAAPKQSATIRDAVRALVGEGSWPKT